MTANHHLADDQLALHYYSEGGSEAAQHLERCEECRARYRALQIVLNSVDSAPVPERGPEYGAAVWKKLAPKLPRRPKRQRWLWLTPREWVLAGVCATLLVGAFLAGRYSRMAPVSPVAGNVNNQPVRERVLLVAVGDYLERSQMVLIELANAPGKQPLNIASAQQNAEDLLEENRLYRQTALSTGDQGMASVLDDLERVLLDVAHSPSTLNQQEIERLQHRLEEQGVLFKIRVLGSRVQQRELNLARQTKSNL